MKKSIVFLLLFLCFFPQSRVKAQDETNYRFTLKTNPLAALGGPLYVTIVPITGEYKVLFEAKTASKQSIELGAGYLGPSVLINLNELSSNDSVGGLKTNGFRVQVAYKFFLTKESAPEGFFVGPHISYAKARLTNKDMTSQYFDASKLNFDVLLGYQLITKGGFTLEVYTGLGVKIRDYSFSQDSGDAFDFTLPNRVVPNVPFGFSFGYAF
jgi:hypothetical protein